MATNQLLNVFHEQLQDMYSVEKQFNDVLPYMIDATSSLVLKEAFKNHLQVIGKHVSIICQLFNQIGLSHETVKCDDDMVRLTEEALSVTNQKVAPAVRDTNLINVARKIERYIIATIDMLITWAQVLSESAILDILEELLNDEYEADKILSDLAEINVK